MIAFTCPDCGQQLTLEDECAAKNASCPHCKQRVPVSATALAPEPTLDANATLLGSGNAPGPARDGVEGLDFLAPPQGPGELGRLGSYRILKVLGEGGLGMVLLAEDLILKRSVALKVMRPELMVRKQARQRFLREAQATAAIEHPHIVTLYQVGEDRGLPFLAMPFLKGEPLDERLRREKTLAVAEAVYLGRQIAEGLAAAHEHGLIHRDIKPGNIWLEPYAGKRGAPPRSWVKILDFGLARAVADDVQLTKSGVILGTPAYMAPEQARAEKVDGRCDLFSLGGVLYHMLTGDPPFKGADTMSLLMALAVQEPRPVRELRPDAPPALADLVQQLLAKDAGGRPESAQAVADALAEMEETALPLPPAPDIPAPATPVKAAAMEEAALPLPPPTPAAVAPAPPVKAAVIEEAGMPLPPPAPAVVAPARRVKVSAKRREKTRPQWLLPAAGGGVLLALLVGVIWLFGPSESGERMKNEISYLLGVKEKPRGHDAIKVWGKEIEDGVGMKLVRIPPGTFTMGSPPDEKDRGNEEQHEVEITKEFWMGIHEVTQKQFKDVMGYNPSYFSKDGEGAPGVMYLVRPAGGKDQAPADTSRFPVENVSWGEARDFCEKLTKREGGKYRLPTEAEWEYACRGGARSSTPFHTGHSLTSHQANFNGDLGRTSEVGSYQPNGFGLFDMHGNVWEWCADWHGSNYYGTSPQRDPPGPVEGSVRVVRGGSCLTAARICRSADRFSEPPASRQRGLGFRVVLVPSSR